MSDIREALVALLNHPDHAPMSTHDPRDGSCQSCPWPLHEMPPEDIADAILAEFDVTPRGERVKPSVEDVARALADDWNPDRDPILTAMFRDYAQTVLALLPGRTETEVKAEALREAQDELVRRDAFTERSLRVLDELIEKGEGRG